MGLGGLLKMEKSPPGCKKKLLTTQWATDTLSGNSKSFLYNSIPKTPREVNTPQCPALIP